MEPHTFVKYYKSNNKGVKITQRINPRKYTYEFREEAVKLLTEQSYTVTEAAKSLGITTKLLYNLKDKFTKQASGEALSKDERAELVKLRKEKTLADGA